MARLLYQFALYEAAEDSEGNLYADQELATTIMDEYNIEHALGVLLDTGCPWDRDRPIWDYVTVLARMVPIVIEVRVISRTEEILSGLAINLVAGFPRLAQEYINGKCPD